MRAVDAFVSFFVSHKKILGRILSVVVGVGGIYYVFSNVDAHELVASLSQTNVVLFLLGFLLMAPVYLLMAERWRRVLGEKGVFVELREAALQICEAQFVNVFMPARGGDIYRGYLASGERGTLRTSVLVLMERIMDVIVLLVLTFVVLVVSFRQGFLFGYVALGTGLLVAAYVGFRVMMRFEKMPVPFVDDLYAKLREALLEDLQTERKVQLFTLTVLIWVVGVGRVAAVAWSLDLPVSVGFIALLSFAWALIAAIPVTPSGLGTVDAAAAFLLQQYGVPPAAATSFILLNRATIQGFPLLVGGLIYFVRNIKGRAR